MRRVAEPCKYVLEGKYIFIVAKKKMAGALSCVLA